MFDDGPVPAIVASAAASDYYQPTLDVGKSPLNVPSTRLQTALAERRFNYARSSTFRSPTKWSVLRSFLNEKTDGVTFEANVGQSRSAMFAENDEMMAVVDLEYGDDYTITVAANLADTASKWLDAFEALLPGYPPPPPPVPLPFNIVPVQFWMQNPGNGEAYARRRNITVQPWDEISANYPLNVRQELESLVKLDGPTGGKLALFHGAPGTGKTRLLLSLISEWRDWCSASVVTDTDRFFGDPTYCNSLIFNSDGRKEWLLLILEDADEFLNVGGKESKGQSISRLLNLADGIVGQGLNLLTIMTTNVSVEELNPAVVRAGRCMSNVHVGAFPADEATAWLNERGMADRSITEPTTLANLYATLNAS